MPKLGATGTKTAQLESANLQVFRGFSRSRLVGVSARIAFITRPSVRSAYAFALAEKQKSLERVRYQALSRGRRHPRARQPAWGGPWGGRKATVTAAVSKKQLKEFRENQLLDLCTFASSASRSKNWCSVATGTFLLLKNATTATSHPVFETSKSPLRKSPNLQIANPLYLSRFPDDSGRQATTDYSGLNPPLSAIPILPCILLHS